MTVKRQPTVRSKTITTTEPPSSVRPPRVKARSPQAPAPATTSPEATLRPEDMTTTDEVYDRLRALSLEGLELLRRSDELGGAVLPVELAPGLSNLLRFALGEMSARESTRKRRTNIVDEFTEPLDLGLATEENSAPPLLEKWEL